MSSTNLPAVSLTDSEALDRALAMVVEQSFFAVVEPVPDAVPVVAGTIVSARVTFDGAFCGSLTCRMPRTLAHELTAAFIGEDVAADSDAVNDLVGEFANMVCGRWLTDVAPESLFRVARPVVGPSDQPWAVPSAQPSGVVNGQPIWVELTADRRDDARGDTTPDASSDHRMP